MVYSNTSQSLDFINRLDISVRVQASNCATPSHFVGRTHTTRGCSEARVLEESV